MTFRPSFRLLIALFALVFVLAACGGSDPTSAAESVGEAIDEPTASDAPEPDPEQPQIVIEEAVVPEIDNRTEREIAIDELDLMLLQLGTVDLVETADCVIGRLDSEGIEIVGQGAPEIIAALGCDPGVANQLFSAGAFAVPPAQGACIVDGLSSAAAAVPLPEAEAFFSAQTPPDAVIEEIASVCGVSEEELAAGFG